MASCNYTPATLKRRVTVQQVVQFPDGQGGFTEIWEDVTQLWASLDPLKGWELMQAQQLTAPITHKVVVRYRPGLSAAMRLLYGARVLVIKEIINPNESNTFLQMRCIETPQVTADIGNAYFQDGSGWLNQDGGAFLYNG